MGRYQNMSNYSLNKFSEFYEELKQVKDNDLKSKLDKRLDGLVSMVNDSLAGPVKVETLDMCPNEYEERVMDRLRCLLFHEGN